MKCQLQIKVCSVTCARNYTWKLLLAVYLLERLFSGYDRCLNYLYRFFTNCCCGIIYCANGLSQSYILSFCKTIVIISPSPLNAQHIAQTHTHGTNKKQVHYSYIKRSLQFFKMLYIAYIIESMVLIN